MSGAPSAEARYQQAGQFLWRLAPHATRFTFQTFSDSPKTSPDPRALARILHGTLDEHWQTLNELSRHGAGIFVTVNETDLRGRTHDNIVRARAFFVDSDNAALSVLKRFPIPPHIITVSSQRTTDPNEFRWHAYYLVEGINLADFTPTQKRFALLLGTDPTVVDLPRVMRLPGFPHQKNPEHPFWVSARCDSTRAPLSTSEFMHALAEAESKASTLPTCESTTVYTGAEATAPSSDRPARTSLVAAASNTSAPATYSMREDVRIRDALRFVSAESRETWLRIGMALHSTSWGQPAYEIWRAWSTSTPGKFDEADQERTWANFDRPRTGTTITLASLFDLARKGGWNGTTGYHPTDLGNAKRLVADHGNDIRYVPAWKKWLIWNGHLWRVDEDGHVMRLAKATTEAMLNEAAAISDPDKRTAARKYALASQSQRRLEAMVELAKSESEISVAADRFDQDPYLLGVDNGVIDLRTGAFRLATRTDFITRCAGASYDPNAACPNFEALVSFVTCGDRELAAYFQRVVGYSLTGLVHEEVIFVLHGTGRNGKSTFREAVADLLGDYAIASDAGLLMTKQNQGGPTPDVARLQGRRLVAINETAENDQLNETRVKFITGQDRIQARKLYGDPFEFNPTHKTFLTTNHKPIIRGTDDGIWRRVHLIPFHAVVQPNAVERDFRERRLRPELAGILNWALLGLTSYQREGLRPPQVVRAATEGYRSDMDVVGQWLDERCIVDPSCATPSALVFADYQNWAQSTIGFAMTPLKFRRTLTERNFVGRKGTEGQRQIAGLRLRFTHPAPLTLVQRVDTKWR